LTPTDVRSYAAAPVAVVDAVAERDCPAAPALGTVMTVLLQPAAHVAVIPVALGLDGGSATFRALGVVALAAHLSLGLALRACRLALRTRQPQLPDTCERLVAPSEHGSTLLVSDVHV
jgi:hypothetical protein